MNLPARLSFACILAMSLVLAVAAPGVAQTKDTFTVTGQNLGRYESRAVEPSDARLSMELEDRVLGRLLAGHLEAGHYIEQWTFDRSAIVYMQLESGILFSNRGDAETTIELFCSNDPDRLCETPEYKSAGRHFQTLTYVLKSHHVACGGAYFIGEAGVSETGPGLYGNYSLRSVACVDNRFDRATALAKATRYMSLVRKGGRQLANVDSEDALAPAPSQPVAQASTVATTPTAPFATMPAAYRWEGVADLASGELTVSTKGNEGDLTARMGGSVGECKGRWQRKGGPQRSAAGSYGVWFMACTNGATASGTYEMTGARVGTGEGRDGQGRTVNVRFGK